eukprot:COSAG01_NODE_25_length_37050_cov_211.559119_29_plen_60_part_00
MVVYKKLRSRNPETKQLMRDSILNALEMLVSPRRYQNVGFTFGSNDNRGAPCDAEELHM